MITPQFFRPHDWIKRNMTDKQALRQCERLYIAGGCVPAFARVLVPWDVLQTARFRSRCCCLSHIAGLPAGLRTTPDTMVNALGTTSGSQKMV